MSLSLRLVGGGGDINILHLKVSVLTTNNDTSCIFLPIVLPVVACWDKKTYLNFQQQQNTIMFIFYFLLFYNKYINKLEYHSSKIKTFSKIKLSPSNKIILFKLQTNNLDPDQNVL